MTTNTVDLRPQAFFSYCSHNYDPHVADTLFTKLQKALEGHISCLYRYTQDDENDGGETLNDYLEKKIRDSLIFFAAMTMEYMTARTSLFELHIAKQLWDTYKESPDNLNRIVVLPLLLSNPSELRDKWNNATDKPCYSNDEMIQWATQGTDSIPAYNPNDAENWTRLINVVVKRAQDLTRHASRQTEQPSPLANALKVQAGRLKVSCRTIPTSVQECSAVIDTHCLETLVATTELLNLIQDFGPNSGQVADYVHTVFGSRADKL